MILSQQQAIFPSAFLQLASFLEGRNYHNVIKLKLSNSGRPRHCTTLIPETRSTTFYSSGKGGINTQIEILSENEEVFLVLESDKV